MVNVMWEGNITLTTDLRTDLNVYFLKRWKMFSENLLGFLVYFFIEFLQLTPEVVEFLLQNGKNDVSKDFIWVKSILSAKRFAQFEKERKDFNQAIILETAQLQRFPGASITCRFTTQNSNRRSCSKKSIFEVQICL